MTAAQRVRRTQIDRSAATRALLIAAATRLLQTVGFARATTALIAQHAGVTTGALHHHFATKDELMLSVLDRTSERVRTRLERQNHLSSNDRLSIEDLVRHLWEIYGDPEYWAIQEIIIGTRADAQMHRRVVAHRLESMRSVLHPWVERHVAASDAKPKIIALFEFMLIAIRGLHLERFLDKDAAYFDRHLRLLAEMVGQRLEGLEQDGHRTGDVTRLK